MFVFGTSEERRGGGERAQVRDSPRSLLKMFETIHRRERERERKRE